MHQDMNMLSLVEEGLDAICQIFPLHQQPLFLLIFLLFFVEVVFL